ncbi:hypothetical protein E3N88_25375 [Mikania micrantha]|uniref:Protein kinase domain-containing protein n=1 Tax=Mikania micrantha TaxID=192012 RepID=A0A5N6N514_9ASTR|nr:hypothetical protein E3N88_25375 [Mikania micrantha]
MKLGAVGIVAYRTYVLGEIIEATNNFHPSNRMGNGELYKGQLGDGTMIAIRNIKIKKRCTITRQIELISKLRHPNLVNPIGHCLDRHPDESAITRGVFLVFEFVPNGTLRDFLTAGQKLSWAQRLAATIGISKGIQFLNTYITQKIFPNNLKITDVLLDQSFRVKINGYNLLLPVEAKENDHDHVYDLGVIMLELILGWSINDINDTAIAKDMLHIGLVADEATRGSIVDALVSKECCDESLKTLMELCVRCLSKDRPSIEDVLWNLEFIAQTQASSSLMEDSLSNQMTTSSNSKFEELPKYVKALKTSSKESLNNVLGDVGLWPIKACIDYTFQKDVSQYAKHAEIAKNCNIYLPHCMWRVFNNRDLCSEDHGVFLYDHLEARYMVTSRMETNDDSGSDYTVYTLEKNAYVANGKQKDFLALMLYLFIVTEMDCLMKLWMLDSVGESKETRQKFQHYAEGDTRIEFEMRWMFITQMNLEIINVVIGDNLESHNQFQHIHDTVSQVMGLAHEGHRLALPMHLTTQPVDSLGNEYVSEVVRGRGERRNTRGAARNNEDLDDEAGPSNLQHLAHDPQTFKILKQEDH